MMMVLSWLTYKRLGKNLKTKDVLVLRIFPNECVITPFNIARFNEPLYNEVFGITNHFVYASNCKINEKEPRYNETS